MTKRKVLVLGYYFRQNNGDDVFQFVLENYFNQKHEKIQYEFLCIDDLVTIGSDISCVIVGGGDLINDYFFTKLEPFLANKSCPWYAISIGIPYPNLIERGYLDRFDYVIHRNQEDIPLLKRRLTERTEWYPDISFLLPKTSEIEYPNGLVRRKKIGIFLSRHIYNEKNPSFYETIVNNLSQFFSGIALQKNIMKKPIYELYFIPFCTDGKIDHDDRLINRDVYNKLTHLNNVYIIDEPLKMDRIIPIFNSFYMTICTRFHSHIFSLISKVPILSIYSTRKVENFLSEIGAKEYSYQMETDSDMYPINANEKILMEKFLSIENNYADYLTKLETTHKLYFDKTLEFTGTMDNLLFYLPRYTLPDEIPKKSLEYARKIAKKLNIIKRDILDLDLIDNKSVYDMLSRSSNKLVQIITSQRKTKTNNKAEITKLIETNGYIGKYFRNFDHNVRNGIVELISYVLTGEKKSDYHYGLNQQVFTSHYNLKESCEWILTHQNKHQNQSRYNYDYIHNNKYKLSNRKLNLTGINFNLFSGYHRSGWSYVLNSMKELHNPEGIIFDSYLDKTFGWEYDFLSLARMIPYKKHWIGVFHHTANEDYSDNNLAKIFTRNNFLNSLKYCKGIITLSNNNQTYIMQKLNMLNFSKIPVLSLTHPTEIPDKNLFNYKIFKMSPVKKVIQIGAWLRNTYAIYELNVPKGYYKFVLKGKDMNNYFLSDQNIAEISDHIRTIGYNNSCRISGGDNGGRISGGSPSGHQKMNKYSLGLANLIERNHQSVTLLEGLTNDQYDHLLSQNIVFINLADASAVNTVLECIVRNTPILINRLPATEEYLGSDYPLFYNTYQEIFELLSDIKNIKKAYLYLSRMNKTRFHIDYFMNELINSKLYHDM